MRCKHCNSEMILDTGKILLSYPPKQVYTCPRCGSIVCVSLDDGSVFARVDESNPTGVVGKIEIPAPTKEEIEAQIRADERKKVVEEIRQRLKKANLEIMSPIDLYSYTDNFLYQVEKGEKHE